VPERACKAGALPAELHAHCNSIILIDRTGKWLKMTAGCKQMLLSTFSRMRIRLKVNTDGSCVAYFCGDDNCPGLTEMGGSLGTLNGLPSSR